MHIKIKRIAIFSSIFLAVFFSFAYFVKIRTGEWNHGLSPIVRWKCALYWGECDDETGCHFTKIPNTGILEYLGINEIPGENFENKE
jgi:hypothetical protein